jgi:hypothetical protein
MDLPMRAGKALGGQKRLDSPPSPAAYRAKMQATIRLQLRRSRLDAGCRDWYRDIKRTDRFNNRLHCVLNKLPTLASVVRHSVLYLLSEEVRDWRQERVSADRRQVEGHFATLQRRHSRQRTGRPKVAVEGGASPNQCARARLGHRHDVDVGTIA